MPQSECIRILVVDDHPMVRSGLKDFILAYDWLELVGEAQNGLECVEFCSLHDVDIVLMDLVMPLMDGSEATKRILEFGKPLKVIILTSYHEQEQVQKALKAGATSYLLKNVSAAELAEAIRSAHLGFSTLAPEATRALILPDPHPPTYSFDLTDRELEVLALLVKGFSNQKISDSLHISIATVKYHLTRLFSKLGARNRIEAVTIALESNLIKKQP